MKLAKLTNVVLEYASSSNFGRLYERYNQLNFSEREILAKDLTRMSGSTILKDEYPRVPFCQLLVCSVPASIPVIERLITRFDNQIDYEVHFSLFCWLDSLQHVPQTELVSQFILRIPYMIGRYLLQVPVKTASAAWMAGDLLGDHWTVQPALPILLSMAVSARNVAGRLGALHGLEQIYRRVAIEERVLIDEAFELLRKDDRSERVRSSAGRTIERLQENFK